MLTEHNDTSRKIIHVDMDAFFAAVEVRDHPELKGKPVIVGGDPNSRGVVSTCSYEARKFGVHSAMASSLARRLCPEGIFVHSNFGAYRDASCIIREVFHEYTDLVETMSLDEAYMDVTQNKVNNPSATLIAREIKHKILERTQLTCSAGVSYNMFLAKIASELEKPDGLVVIRPEDAEAVLEKLEIGKFYGIGKVTEKKFIELGIKTGAELKAWSVKDLIQHFGKSGYYYYRIVRGIDSRPVTPERLSKSIGHETTFDKDLDNFPEMVTILEELAEEVEKRMRKEGAKAKTTTLKLKYEDFQSITRSRTERVAIDDAKHIFKNVRDLLIQTNPRQKVRLLGISMSNLVFEDSEENDQLMLDFYEKEADT
jgi:DNA polymerase IV